MEVSNVDQHREWLLRSQQIDLSQLDRERLEQLTISLLHGQIVIFEELGRETRQSEIIKAQQGMINGLQQQLSEANRNLIEASTTLTTLQHPADQAYRDTFMLLIDLVMRVWGESGRDQAVENLLMGLWRGLATAVEIGDIEQSNLIVQWWAQTARENFGFPRAGQPQLDADGENEDEVAESIGGEFGDDDSSCEVGDDAPEEADAG